MKISIAPPNSPEKAARRFADSSPGKFYGVLYAALAGVSAVFFTMPFVSSLPIAILYAYILTIGTASPFIVYRFNRRLGRPQAIVAGAAVGVTYVISLAAIYVSQLNL